MYIYFNYFGNYIFLKIKVYSKWFGNGLATTIKKARNVLITTQLQTFNVPEAGVEPARFPTGV